MKQRSLADLAQWIGGRIEVPPATESTRAPQALTPLGATRIGPDVVIDSRRATPGSLFVALPGEQVDGHDYTVKAAELGAAAVLATRLTEAPVPHVIVDDAIDGLSRLARSLVAEHAADGLMTVAVTGSSGKTSTKDLLAQLFEAAGPTVAPVGSFNNEIGVPLTATRVDDGTRFLISEMGARGLGHIAWLCSMTPPTIAAVLNVGSAHLGEFGSVEGITRAKGEIVEALPADGWAILNADDARVAAMADRTQARVAWFSVADARPEVDGPLVWASDLTLDALQRPSFELHFAGEAHETHHVALPLLGRHMAANAVAAAAVAWRAGVEPALIAATLSRVEHRSRWRMQLGQTRSGAAVINDAYNANPDSMRAALATLGAIGRARKAEHEQSRTIAILGDMLELGDDAVSLHREVGRWAAQAGVDTLLAVGDHAHDVVAGFGDGPGQAKVSSIDEAGSLDLARHDVALVKASRGLALERVAAELLAHPTEENL